jgi:large subunit ribosomal protein L23
MKSNIIRPIITEKTMHRTTGSWFTFRADIFANKQNLKQEIEKLYAVTVIAIRTANMHGKVHRVGKKSKFVEAADWKKVMVQLKSGQTIDAFQIGGPEETK